VSGPGRLGSRRPARALAFLAVRFPFTFLGLTALVFGLWIAVYVASHPGLDSGSRDLAIGTIVLSWAFGAYVVVRRVRRGPQH
jgi:hypothetical protein